MVREPLSSACSASTSGSDITERGHRVQATFVAGHGCAWLFLVAQRSHANPQGFESSNKIDCEVQVRSGGPNPNPWCCSNPKFPSKQEDEKGLEACGNHCSYTFPVSATQTKASVTVLVSSTRDTTCGLGEKEVVVSQILLRKQICRSGTGLTEQALTVPQFLSKAILCSTFSGQDFFVFVFCLFLNKPRSVLRNTLKCRIFEVGNWTLILTGFHMRNIQKVNKRDPLKNVLEPCITYFGSVGSRLQDFTDPREASYHWVTSLASKSQEF